MGTEAAHLARLSASLPQSLLRRLDTMIAERSLCSRSQMIADLIREALAEHAALARLDQTLTVTITMVYRGDRSRIREQMALTRADYAREVISSQHVFLEDGQSLEVLLVQGHAARLKSLCDALRATRGVLQLGMVATAALVPPMHGRLAAITAPPAQAA